MKTSVLCAAKAALGKADALPKYYEQWRPFHGCLRCFRITSPKRIKQFYEKYRNERDKINILDREPKNHVLDRELKLGYFIYNKKKRKTINNFY